MIMEHDPPQERNWLEISRSSDLEGSRALIPIELGKNQYILFRDDEGYLGLIGRNCPHRGADLCYGRLDKPSHKLFLIQFFRFSSKQ